jgi:nucleoside-diphosphate kinase
VAGESTFIMVKPDGVARGLVGEIIGRFERRGLQLRKIRMLTIDGDLADRHYAEHVEKPFYPDLKAFITSGPVVAMEWSGPNAVQAGRDLMGEGTNPMECTPGSIRGDYGLELTQNIVHGSDSPDSAVRELGIFFAE